MSRTWFSVAVVLLAGGGAAAQAPYTVEKVKEPPPKELAGPVRELLRDEAYRLAEGKEVLGTIWLRKEVPSPATAEQVKNGLTYRDVPHTTLFGALRLEKAWHDFRKQEIKPGVYTLRLGFQPQDGDHMGTAPYNEFFLPIPADKDVKPDPMDVREMQELSAAAPGGTHPGVMLLFPNSPPEEPGKLADKGEGIWVLNLKQPVRTEQGARTTLGLGLVVAGHSASE